MKKTIKALKFSIVFLLITLSFIACDKEFSVIESDVLGKGNANFLTDSMDVPVSAYNKKLNALQINNLSSNLLGFFDDPEFGQTIASIVTQVTPTSFNPAFGVDPVIDSVVLSIPYFSKIIGTNTDGNIYSIKDSLYGDSEIKLSIYHNNYFLRSFNPTSPNSPQNYFSNGGSNNGVGPTDNSAFTENNTINFDDHKGILLQDFTFKPSAEAIKTSVGEGADKVTSRGVPALRTFLDDTEDTKNFWKTTFIDIEGRPELSNASNFNDYFRGLYLKAEAIGGQGNMILLDINSTDANITIHYSKGEENSRTQDAYTLNFRGGNKLNTFINNYTTTFADGDPNLGDETLYLKGAEGSMAVVDLFGNEDADGDNTPDALEDFIDDFRISDPDDESGYLKDNTTGNFVLKKLINEAQLIIYEDQSLTISSHGEDEEDYHKYDRIYAYDIANNSIIADYETDQTENTQSPLSSRIFHLGQRDTDKKYKIRLTQHLNNILLRDSTNTKIGLVLSTNVNYINNAEILNSNDDGVTAVPAAAILSPRGTILHGSAESVAPAKKRMKLQVFFTDPEDN
ncbi:DUF4270 domain-containing protein [Flavivirga abyssicola]|uniref:DUF4270 domain-containing protein n=1 Tax=Flavivirga abyssicola TaxID=3063533 RepID=UPI0026DF4DDB|nr:DUF4270 domain-containing protein [Flavivirga sp. MEBiC07777]WVK14581.1 DUF4270 domain-containing protein [Flavivirga sp. MEBiC07777]